MPSHISDLRAYVDARTSRGDGCWLWRGSRTRAGYGRVAVRSADAKRTVQHYVHRLVYEWHHGPIADGLVVRHACDTPACVNPQHLELGTQAENVQDMVTRGRHGKHGGAPAPPSLPALPLPAPAATRCRRGHPYTPENTIVKGPSGARACRACRQLRARNRYADRRDGGARGV